MTFYGLSRQFFKIGGFTLVTVETVFFPLSDITVWPKKILST